jgi:mono/diheme cytochrome c family protein
MASGGIRSLLSMQATCRKETNMKCKLLIRVPFLVASLVVLPTLSWGAEDGAALYKSKCAVCHGASGEGKPTMKAPALRGTPLTADQITEHTVKGTVNSKAPHNKGISGMSDAQAKAISEFVKTLLPGAKSR